MGSFHTNNRAVELQLFRKFIKNQQVQYMEWPELELSNAIRPLVCEDKDDGASSSESGYCGFHSDILNPFKAEVVLSANDTCKLLPSIKQRSFLPEDLRVINEYMSSFGPSYVRTLIIHKVSKSLLFNGDLYGTYFSGRKNCSLVIVRMLTSSGTYNQSPCFIIGFVQCTVIMKQENENSSLDFILCKVVQLIEHSEKNKFLYPIEIWQKPHNILACSYSFVAVSSLLCCCAYSSKFIDNTDDSITTVVPCNPYFGLVFFPMASLENTDI